MTNAQATDHTGAAVEVTLDETRGAYQIALVDGGEVAGRTFFLDRPGERVFYHTEVDEAFGGRGLATILVQQALDATRAEGGRTIVPVCPLVRAFLKKHADEYEGAFRGNRAEDGEWVREQLAHR